MNNQLLTLINQLATISKQHHHYCEDSWYSCPKCSEGCSDESQGENCNCGAEKHNKKVDELLFDIKKLLSSTKWKPLEFIENE